jgi:hypothetical protein
MNAGMHVPGASRSRRRLAAVLLPGLACAALAASGCADTLQNQPVPHNTLETLLVAPYPVYWLGGSFRGLQITEVTHDPSGAFSVQYGNCAEGGQGTCVAPVRVVTSPDNSFLPGESAGAAGVALRGARALVARRGRTILVPTGGVVIGIYALRSELAGAAAQTAVPINASGVPGERLAPRQPDTGFAETPLPVQMPSPLRALR